MTGRDDQCRVFQRAQVVQRIGIQHKQISGFADFQRTGLGIDAENGGVDGSGCVQGLSRTETGICDQQLQLTPCGVLRHECHACIGADAYHQSGLVRLTST